MLVIKENNRKIKYIHDLIYIAIYHQKRQTMFSDGKTQPHMLLLLHHKNNGYPNKLAKINILEEFKLINLSR